MKAIFSYEKVCQITAFDLRHLNNSSFIINEKMVENVLRVIWKTFCTYIYIWKNSNFKAKYILGHN